MNRVGNLCTIEARAFNAPDMELLSWQQHIQVFHRLDYAKRQRLLSVLGVSMLKVAGVMLSFSKVVQMLKPPLIWKPHC